VAREKACQQEVNGLPSLGWGLLLGQVDHIGPEGMSDADYKRDRLITVERLLASLLVLLWIGLAGKMGGLALAFRALLLFMVPLAMIWLPELFARIALRDSRWERDFSPPPSGLVLRICSWFVILGVPGSWFLFQWIARH
jgi:hypothetical protein